MKRKERIYIFLIVLLSALFIGLFCLVLSGWFFKDTKPAETSLIVGSTSIIEVGGTETGILSFNFDGSYLGGEEIKQNISIKNGSENGLYLRAKITIFSGKNDDPKIELATTENWTKMDDGYYYFDGFVEGLETIGLISGFKISDETQLVSSSNYILVISVEALSTDFDRTLVWNY